MKRYLLFGGDVYYPNGGWGDYIGSYSSIVEALEKEANLGHDWWHIVDKNTMKIVRKNGK